MVTNIVIALGLGLIGLGVLLALIAGVRNVMDGRSDLKRVGMMGVPVVVFVIFYFSLGNLNQAGVATLLVMMGLMILGIVISSTRRTFNF